jgi:hypothetical protein
MDFSPTGRGKKNFSSNSLSKISQVEFPFQVQAGNPVFGLTRMPFGLPGADF